MLEILSQAFTCVNALALFLMLAGLGNALGVRFFFLPKKQGLFPAAFMGFGIAYGLSTLLLSMLYRSTKNFTHAWAIYLTLLVLYTVVVLSVRRFPKRKDFARSEYALIAIALFVGVLSAVGNLTVWCSSQFIGMGHSDKYAMFSKLFLWSDDPVELSQHYASTLMTAGVYLLTRWDLEAINWLTHTLLKIGLLCLIYTSAFEWSRGKKHVAVFTTLAFSLVSGSFSFQLFDYIDSGGPFLMMTYPDRVLGFYAVFLWIWTLRSILKGSDKASLVSPVFFALVWGAVLAFLAIAAEDLLVLLSIPIGATGLWALREVYRRKKSEFWNSFVASAAVAFGLMYLVTTQGGLLANRPQQPAGRDPLKYAAGSGEHQVKIQSSARFNPTPSLWYRIYPTERAQVCHQFVNAEGWAAFKELAKIAGLGFLAFMLLFAAKRLFPKWENVLWNPEHLAFRTMFLWFSVVGVPLALFFNDGVGGETVSRFFQWGLFLSFTMVGYLSATLFRRPLATKIAAVLILGLASYPMLEFFSRPYMLMHLRQLASIPQKGLVEAVRNP
jgi:hypothetical protein